MRIAILTRGDLFPAIHGAAVKIVRTAEALAALGDHVCVVTEDRESYWRVSREGWEQVAYEPRARALQEWPLFRDQARAERWLARIGYPRDEWFLYRPVVDPAWWARVLYVGVRERIDVYQAEFPGYAVPATLAARMIGGRSVVVEHNVEYDRLGQMTDLDPSILARIRRIELGALRASDQVIAVSEDDRRRLVEAGVPRAHVAVVPLGVRMSDFDGRRLNLQEMYGVSGPVLFFHGTLHYAPNTEGLRFLAELAPKLPAGATILAAGMSPPRELESDRLRFLGPVDDLAGHIAAADVCLCPIFAGGGTRMKLLEYFAAGKPVVSTRVGAEGLLVNDGEHLLLAEREDFLPAIERVIEDSDLRDRLGRAARAYASARDWSAVALAYQKIYKGERADFTPRPSIESHLPPRVPSKPLTLLLLVNRGCNLRCVFCDLWDKPKNMPLERTLTLLDEAVAIGTKILVLTGGEPFLHPDLPTIVTEARKRGLSVNITTNGTILDRQYSALVAAGVNSMSFSLDGLGPTHDRLRGRKGAWQKTWDALMRVVHDGKVDPCVYMVVNKENIHELIPLWEKVRAAGVRFDFWPVNDAPDIYLNTPEEQQAWKDAVAYIARHDADVAARKHYYEEGLRYHAGEPAAMRCLGLVDQYGVTFEGDLLPCCVWGGEGLKVGNVFQTPLRELWTRPDVQRFRERLYGQGCAAGCYNHSLYEFVVSTGESHRVVGSEAPLTR